MRAMGDTMSLLGNIIWILFGGIFTAIYWFFVGCLFCLTIVGIPLGRQAFKMASLTLAPFGKTIEYGGGAPSLIANIIWVVVAGIPMAFAYLVAGAVNCITIIGIPFGLQSFKMAKLSLLPFGARVNQAVATRIAPKAKTAPPPPCAPVILWMRQIRINAPAHPRSGRLHAER